MDVGFERVKGRDAGSRGGRGQGGVAGAATRRCSHTAGCHSRQQATTSGHQPGQLAIGCRLNKATGWRRSRQEVEKQSRSRAQSEEVSQPASHLPGSLSMSPGVGSSFLVHSAMRPRSRSWLSTITCGAGGGKEGGDVRQGGWKPAARQRVGAVQPAKCPSRSVNVQTTRGTTVHQPAALPPLT